jgi:hypothetical protein
MDNEFKALLDSIPDKPPRSRLAPYFELIEELRRRGRTYRDIVAILADKCHVRVAHSTLHAYLKNRSDGPKVRPSRPPAAANSSDLVEADTPHPGALRQKIAALKAGKSPEQSIGRAFKFDAEEPLRIKLNDRRTTEK